MKQTICKKLTILLSTLTLCCSAISYAGDDKTKDAIPSKPYFYTGANEDEVIRFDRSILQNSRHFAVNLALKTFASEVYRVLQDTKTYLFQQNQIALMQDVLDELKAINTNLTDRSAITKAELQHQRMKRLADEINKYPLHSSGDGVITDDVKFDVSKYQEEVLKLYAPQIAELKRQLEEVANHWNPCYWNPSNNKGVVSARFIEAAKAFNNKQPEDNDRDNILRWPVGSVASKSTALGQVADYYANQLAIQNAIFAKHGITELPMKPKTNTVDLSKIEMPRITSSNSGIDFVLPENFKLISSAELIALAQEIFNRSSFQKDIAALIQQELRKATPLSTQQSKTGDGDSGIDIATGGYDVTS